MVKCVPSVGQVAAALPAYSFEVEQNLTINTKDDKSELIARLIETGYSDLEIADKIFPSQNLDGRMTDAKAAFINKIARMRKALEGK